MKNCFLAEFYEEGIFHVYNRTNNKEPLFITEENKRYFLSQFSKYLQPFLNTYCWCLLPNHFHFLISVKDRESIVGHLVSKEPVLLKSIERKYLNGEVGAELLITLEWKRFFTAYSMAFNKQHNRSGNLFHRPFKRLEIKDDHHFTRAVFYIHSNAAKHKIIADFTKYKWSSWQSLVSDKNTLLCRSKLLDWFGGLSRMIEIHKSMSQEYYSNDIAIEDE